MDDHQRWDVFPPSTQELTDDLNGACGSELLLQDTFVPDIVSKRFQEGARLSFEHENQSPRSPHFGGEILARIFCSLRHYEVVIPFT